MGDVEEDPVIRKHTQSVSGEKADGNQQGMSVSRGLTKRLKNRAERRRAKQDPEAPPGYGKYRGWLT
jgi:hypothetical protein